MSEKVDSFTNGGSSFFCTSFKEHCDYNSSAANEINLQGNTTFTFRNAASSSDQRITVSCPERYEVKGVTEFTCGVYSNWIAEGCSFNGTNGKSTCQNPPTCIPSKLATKAGILGHGN